MADGTAKPVIFISYSHKDEPEHPRDGEVQWLSFVRTYLQPAIKHGIFDLFVDEHLSGGADLKPEIERKLRACDVFIPLISANSTASDYIVDTEIRITRERIANGEDVCFYPVILTPTPKIALDKFKDKVIRPDDAKPLSSFPYAERIQKITEIADEIANIATEIVGRKPAPPKRGPQPAYVHITGLPETPYERLVGRDDELKRLDDAWTDSKINILSLIAEGGAGKSALVNEWLRRLQAANYRGAEAVLGWSFYSQGSKERATAADEFLNWALEKLGITLETTSASAKAEAIADAMMRRRVLLVLDGVEPLQHGLDTQLGQLKDQGLRALLRRFASTPPAQAHGLVVLTSRLAVKDIARWQDDAAPVGNVERLSDEAGAALLRDNGVWGTDKEVKAAAHDFGDHPLALGLLASFLKETQKGDVRRRDHIRAYFADPDNPRHDHAKRVMESYEKEWLAGQPALLAIMHMVGLFDRPASGDCLNALRAEPAIEGLTDQIVELDESAWERAVARLREVRLLAPLDPTAPDALDAHPLVREWFGERLKWTNETASKAAHGRLYEHLRDKTNEGEIPRLEDLTPLYQAIAHGCHACRYAEAFEQIYLARICRGTEYAEPRYHSINTLGSVGSDLAAMSWFFEEPYSTPISHLEASDRTFMQGLAGTFLRLVGRVSESLPAERKSLESSVAAEDWPNSAIGAMNLAQAMLLVGDLVGAKKVSERAIEYADQSFRPELATDTRANYAYSLLALGHFSEASHYFWISERMQRRIDPSSPYLYTLRGTYYCELLLMKGAFREVRERTADMINISDANSWLMDAAIETFIAFRAQMALILQDADALIFDMKGNAKAEIDNAIEDLRTSGNLENLARGHLVLLSQKVTDRRDRESITWRGSSLARRLR